ncbi:MAG: hypothetical protein LBO78_02735, partial [Rickettsiales bacterium]|nr:hypothetical protein [Rickettsiales bacterium]
MKDISQKLAGARIELAALEPTFKNAEMMFQAVDKNRGYLLPWLGWAAPDVTKAPEDSFAAL